MEKAIVVYSGGQDSTTLLYWATSKYDVVGAINFLYGGKHNSKETVFAEYHAKNLNIPFTRINLDFNKWGFKSSLLKGGEKVPEGHYSSKSMKSTVIPFRNAIMLSIATGIAETLDAKCVLLGSHKGDTIYPDCSFEFTQAMNLASQFGTYNKVKILSPFNDLMKWDILKIGLDLNKIDYSKTWSCYSPDKKGRPCLKCGTDIERTESFYKNGIQDPLLTDTEWQKALNLMHKYTM